MFVDSYPDLSLLVYLQDFAKKLYYSDNEMLYFTSTEVVAFELREGYVVLLGSEEKYALFVVVREFLD